MSSAHFKLAVSWIDREQTLGEFVDATTDYIRQLQSLHPILNGPLFLNGGLKARSEQIAPDLSNIEGFVRRYGWDKKADERWMTGVLSDGTMSREGTSKVGFTCGILCGGATIKSTEAFVSIHGGKPHTVAPSVVRIDFPVQGWLEFERLDFVKKLLDVTVRCFDPDFGSVTSDEFHEAFIAQAQLDRLSTFKSIGWLNYFANPAVRRDLPPDVECESFGPGGVLLTLQHERPSADDAQAVARAKAIREALLPGNWFEFEKLRKPAAAA
jgi:hypothetical protein